MLLEFPPQSDMTMEKSWGCTQLREPRAAANLRMVRYPQGKVGTWECGARGAVLSVSVYTTGRGERERERRASNNKVSVRKVGK